MSSEERLFIGQAIVWLSVCPVHVRKLSKLVVAVIKMTHFIIYSGCELPENFSSFSNIQQMINDQNYNLEFFQPQR